LGCGTIILPGPQPAHHYLVDPAIYDYPLYLNVDRNPAPGVDEVVDLFRYPWPWDDNSFDGALLSHIVEHIPHEIATTGNGDHAMKLRQCQDGWYAFMSELWRVLTPGAIAHILSPYGWSQGAITDPSHVRLITEHTWTHSLTPDPGHPSFRYNTNGLNLALADDMRFGLYVNWRHLLPVAGDSEDAIARKRILFNEALMTRLNVCNDLCVKLRAVK
jgi:hypothetical protein